jgi:CTP synthase
LPTIDPHSNAARIKERYYRNSASHSHQAPRIDGSGLRIAGCDDHREPRIMESIGHPIRLGAVFFPQLRSTVAEPRPLIVGFLKKGLSWQAVEKWDWLRTRQRIFRQTNAS